MLLLRGCLLSLCVLPSTEGGLLVKSNAMGFAWGALVFGEAFCVWQIEVPRPYWSRAARPGRLLVIP